MRGESRAPTRSNVSFRSSLVLTAPPAALIGSIPKSLPLISNLPWARRTSSVIVTVNGIVTVVVTEDLKFSARVWNGL